GSLLQDALHQYLGQFFGTGHGSLVDTGLPVDAQTDRHFSLGYVEQGVLGAGYGTPVESHPEGAGGVIGLPGDAFGLVDVRPCLDSRTGDLEHRHVTGDPPAVPVVLRRIGGDVVADLDGAYIDP